MAEATGLPLPENPVLDAGEEEPAIRLHSKIIAENGYWTDVSSAQVGFVPVGKNAPEKLCFKRLDYLNDYRYCIELLGTVYLGDGSSDTTAVNYFNKRAALTWDCETYEMSNGCTALLAPAIPTVPLGAAAGLILKKTAFCISWPVRRSPTISTVLWSHWMTAAQHCGKCWMGLNNRLWLPFARGAFFMPAWLRLSAKTGIL